MTQRMVEKVGASVIVARTGRATTINSTRVERILGEWAPSSPDHEWKKALLDACYSSLPDGSEVGRITNLHWIELVELLMHAPGPKAVEAIWRLDGDRGLEALATDRAQELFRQAVDHLAALSLVGREDR